MYKISIVVPIYNVEEFIVESIESVMNQSIGFENIELLLIDDCSTDKSGEIAKNYSEMYENIIYYKLPKNSGMAGKPRNVGMEMATGKYLMFLDPDDIFLNDACEVMFNTIEEKQLIFISANYGKMDINKNVLDDAVINTNKYPSQNYSIQDRQNTMRLLTLSCWNKIIDKKFVLDNKIQFLEGVPGEDAYFSSKLFFEAKKSFYLNKPIGMYRKRTTGNLSVTTNLTEKFFNNLIIANRSIYALCKEYSEHRFYDYYYTSNFIYFIRSLMVSDKIESDRKAEILYSIKNDLLGYSRELKINYNVEIDNIDFNKVFSLDTIEEFKEYIEKMEKVVQALGVVAFKDLVEKIMNELEKQI